jgi:hypothetical protein
MIKLKKNSFPWDIVWLSILTAALFLGAYGVGAAKKALGAEMPASTEKHDAETRNAARRDDDGGLMCAPCKGPHIDLRTGEYRPFPGAGPGLKLYSPKEVQN